MIINRKNIIKALVIIWVFIIMPIISTVNGLEIIDNTDKNHAWMYDRLVQIWTDFMTWKTSLKDVQKEMDHWIWVEVWWLDEWAWWRARVDENWALHIWCVNNADLVVIKPDKNKQIAWW